MSAFILYSVIVYTSILDISVDMGKSKVWHSTSTLLNIHLTYELGVYIIKHSFSCMKHKHFSIT